jgi:hypothetical protein
MMFCNCRRNLTRCHSTVLRYGRGFFSSLPTTPVEHPGIAASCSTPFAGHRTKLFQQFYPPAISHKLLLPVLLTLVFLTGIPCSPFSSRVFPIRTIAALPSILGAAIFSTHLSAQTLPVLDVSKTPTLDSAPGSGFAYSATAKSDTACDSISFSGIPNNRECIRGLLLVFSFFLDETKSSAGLAA